MEDGWSAGARTAATAAAASTARATPTRGNARSAADDSSARSHSRNSPRARSRSANGSPRDGRPSTRRRSSSPPRDRYADAYRLHIEPWLGDLPLTELTVGRLRSWQADRLSGGVGVGTIDKARTVLSSVLRHAAESEAIPCNPLTLVRAPLAEHRDGVTPLAPVTVEAIRAVLADAMDIHVPERIRRGGVRVAGYVVPDERDPLTRQRDATIVSVLAYAGLRPGELRALRWGDIRKATITVERAARPDGTIKSTKNHERRAVRLLAPLATDLAELRLAAGRPADDTLVLAPTGEPTADAHPDAVTWTKTDWQTWRTGRWDRARGLATTPISARPYDLRHSFASLLLAEGRSVHYVARRLGHSPALTLSTYGHLFAEYEHADRINAAAEIAQAGDALGHESRRRMSVTRGRRPRSRESAAVRLEEAPGLRE